MHMDIRGYKKCWGYVTRCIRNEDERVIWMLRSKYDNDSGNSYYV